MVRDVLLCERKVALDIHGRPEERDPVSPFVKMLWRNGVSHESEVLAALSGHTVDLRGLDRATREAGTLRAIVDRAPVILGGVIRHEDLIGMPDVLRWMEYGHVALDVKSGSAVEGPRGVYKREYLVQVAHYAAILGGSRLGRADVAGILDGRAELTVYDLALPIGRARLTGAELHRQLADDVRRIVDDPGGTRPALSASCGMCEWRTVCRRDLIARDDLTLIAGLGRAIRDPLETLACTVADLAGVDADGLAPPPGLGRERLARFAERARLLADPSAGPIIRSPLELARPAHAVDFDVEADPLRGIVYLHGFWHEREGAPGEFVHFFAETPDAAGERDAFASTIAHFRAHPEAHWFHYSAYEKTAYRGLQRRHPDVCSAEEIEGIFASGRCTDLYAVVASRTDWPLSSYGIKSIAKSCGFSWEDTDPGGAASIEWYDQYVSSGDPAIRDRIVAYNRDDVRASAVVRSALAELEETGAVRRFRRPG